MGNFVIMWYLKKIPKILHLYWGNDKISFLRYLTAVSFIKVNPDWTVKVHSSESPCINKTWSTFEHKSFVQPELDFIDKLNDLDIETIKHNFEEYGFRNNVSEVHKADFLRWHLLGSEGGFWSDFDILYINPMDNLCINKKENENVDIGICTYQRNLTAIGFLCGCEDCLFWKHIKILALSRYNPAGYQSIGSQLLNDEFDIAPRIKERFSDSIPIQIHRKSVYHLDYNRVADFYNSNVDVFSDKEIIGLHWYAGNEMSQKFENVLNPDNYKTFDNTICKVIDRILS